jgi:hypothetical protein
VGKIAFVADPHVANYRRWGGEMVNGINQRGRAVLDVLQRCSREAQKHGCDRLIVLGDLFDHTRPTPQLVAHTASALLAHDVPVTVLLGNHDLQSSGPGDNACASLGLDEAIDVIDRPLRRGIAGMEMLFVPYAPGDASDWLTAGLAKLIPDATQVAYNAGKLKVLATHLGIWDDATPPYLKACRDAVGIGHVRWLCDAHKIQRVYAGNWHKAMSWDSRGDIEPKVFIPGTICPNGFQEPDQEKVGYMIILDGSTGQNLFVNIPGPRFFTTRWSRDGKNFARSNGGMGVYLRMIATRADLVAAKQWAANESINGKHIEVVLDPEEYAGAEHRAQVAAAVRSGLSEDDYSGLVQIEEPGTRDGVAKRLREYKRLVSG